VGASAVPQPRVCDLVHVDEAQDAIDVLVVHELLEPP
jgi:hypothetical protein